MHWCLLKAAYREALCSSKRLKNLSRLESILLGYCYSLLGEYRQGLACYQEVLALEPTIA